MSLSKAQWMAIEKLLSAPFGHAKLKCDGYEITAQVRQIGMKLVVAVFVDGRIKGAWLDGKDERCIKFYQCKKQLVLRGKMRASVMEASAKKHLGKETKAMLRRHLEDFIVSWTPYWSSPKAFCRHIQKTCTQIEFME